MKCNTLGVVLSLGCAALLGVASPVAGQTAPGLGAAQSFAIVGGSAVTNTGTTVVTGDLGVSPGSAVSGFPPGTVISGTIHAADAAAFAAQAAVANAYNALSSQACTRDLTGQDLGGLTLTPGVYCFASSAQLTGALTLDAQNNPNAVFIFKIGSTLTTASASSVALINSASPCNIFWQVGTSATMGTGSMLAGNVLAMSSITVTTGARLMGRALAQNGAVTLDTNQITVTCATPPVPPSCATITLTPATLPNGTVAVAYSQAIVGNGGTAPYSFAVTAGALPAGLTLTTSGTLAGLPTTAGTSTFTVRGTDANGCFASVSYTIVIAAATPVPPNCPAISLTPATLPNGTVAVAYNQTITGNGGTAPYSFAVVTGALPAGLTLTTSGTLSGTSTTAGPSTFTIRGTDANGCFASVSYTITIAAATPVPPNCPTITLAPTTLPNGTVGVAYTQTIVASGGTAPYSFGVSTGVLPTGLTLTAAGLLSGTPTTLGQSSVTMRATDALGCFAELPYTISIPTDVPTLPQIFVALLAFGLIAAGYLRLRQRAEAE